MIGPEVRLGPGVAANLSVTTCIDGGTGLTAGPGRSALSSLTWYFGCNVDGPSAAQHQSRQSSRWAPCSTWIDSSRQRLDHKIRIVFSVYPTGIIRYLMPDDLVGLIRYLHQNVAPQ